MIKRFITLTILVLALSAFFQVENRAQGVSRGGDSLEKRNPILEADSTKNLEVARHYFKTKKAYKAVILRLEEVVAANPMFSKMDEVLYLMGMSSFYLSENKGKQKFDPKAKDAEKFAPTKMREDAAAYFNQLVENYPQSLFKTDAEKTLKEIGTLK